MPRQLKLPARTRAYKHETSSTLLFPPPNQVVQIRQPPQYCPHCPPAILAPQLSAGTSLTAAQSSMHLCCFPTEQLLLPSQPVLPTGLICPTVALLCKYPTTPLWPMGLQPCDSSCLLTMLLVYMCTHFIWASVTLIQQK